VGGGFHLKDDCEDRLLEAIRRFDSANSEDLNQLEVEGQSRPRELVYAERLYRWVLALEPEASEALRLAARSQHLRRWQIPRERFPTGRSGYLHWRTELKRFHAEKSGTILAEVGYSQEVIVRVQALNRKENQATDPECQTLEDALCLVFLQYQFAALAAKTPADKMKSILQKTWAKMSTKARARALGIEFGAAERALLTEAVGGNGE